MKENNKELIDALHERLYNMYAPLQETLKEYAQMRLKDLELVAVGEYHNEEVIIKDERDLDADEHVRIEVRHATETENITFPLKITKQVITFPDDERPLIYKNVREKLRMLTKDETIGDEITRLLASNAPLHIMLSILRKTGLLFHFTYGGKVFFYYLFPLPDDFYTFNDEAKDLEDGLREMLNIDCDDDLPLKNPYVLFSSLNSIDKQITQGETPTVKKERLNEFFSAYGSAFDHAFEKYKQELDAFYAPVRQETFAFPSHPVMFALIAMFAGKNQRIPRALLEKPFSEWTAKDQEKSEELIRSVFSDDDKKVYKDGKPHTVKTALIADNKRVLAQSDVTDLLSPYDAAYSEAKLSHHIKQTFGAEGLRHLLGFIIALDRNGRTGKMEFDLNEHLERLGYRKGRDRKFPKELRKRATDIFKIFISLCLDIKKRKKNGRVEHVEIQRLFNVEGFTYERDIYKNEILRESMTIRATDFWYGDAFQPKEHAGKQYVELLEKIAKVDHNANPLTIYLTPLFSVFWRISKSDRHIQKLKMRNLLEWWGEENDTRRMRENMRKIESELNYMKAHGFLGEWTHDGETPLPSECHDPMEVTLTLPPPEWLEGSIKAIQENRPTRLERPVKRLTGESVRRLREHLGLSLSLFGKNIGVTKQAVHNNETKGDDPVSKNLETKIRAHYSSALVSLQM